MSRRLNASRAAAAALIILLLPAGRAFAAQTGVEANGAAAITNHPVSIVSESRPDSAEPVGTVNQATSAPLASRSDDVAKQVHSPIPVSPNENLPIGSPTSVIQSKTDLTSGQIDDGVLGTLDPRSNDVTKVIGALAIVVGLILLLKVFLRKSGGFLAGAGSRPSGVVEILAKYPVGRGQNIVLLKVARRIVLLHQTGSSMTTLSEMTDADEVAEVLARLEAGSTEREAERFRKTLTQFMAEHEAPQEKTMRPRRTPMPLAETEIVDLTRSSRRGFAGLLNRRSGG